MPCPHWEEDTLQNQARLQELQKFVQFSSESPMLCEDDVLWYYEQFLALSKAMTLACYLTDDERDTAFWCGFHPDDHIRLLPYSPDTPPHFEDVFTMARTVFSYKPEPVYMPIPVPASPLPTSLLPPPPTSEPHPSPERSPEICRPASAPPIAQHFNDLGEGDLCPQGDLGSLPGTCQGSDAHETSRTSPPLSLVSFSPLPSLTHSPSSPHAPSPSPPLLEPLPFPQSPVHPSSPPCDLLRTPSPSPFLNVLAAPSPPPPRFDSPSLLTPTPSPYPQSPTHSLSLLRTSSQPMPSPSPALPTRVSSLHDPFPIRLPSPLLSTRALSPSPLSTPDVLPIVLSPLDPVPACPLPLPPDLSPALSPSPSPVHAATSPPPSYPSLSLMSPSQPRLQLLDGLRSAPCDPPLPLAFPLPPPPRPPDPVPARTVKPQPPPAPSLSSTFPSQMFDRTPMLHQSCSLHFPPPPTLLTALVFPPSPLPRPPDPRTASSANAKPQPPTTTGHLPLYIAFRTHHQAAANQ
jgi:hypothetical protein